MSEFPNYYLILEIPETATTEDIREGIHAFTTGLFLRPLQQ
jgi:DnaJ-class molecular chaperone